MKSVTYTPDGKEIEHELTAEEEAEVKKREKEEEEKVNATKYAFDRQMEYPDLAEQLDYIYHNGVAKWKTDMIDPVKTKYPKG